MNTHKSRFSWSGTLHPSRATFGCVSLAWFKVVEPHAHADVSGSVQIAGALVISDDFTTHDDMLGGHLKDRTKEILQIVKDGIILDRICICAVCGYI